MKSELRRAIDRRPAALGAGGVLTAPSGTASSTASNVAIVDAGGYFDAVEVESALQEIGAALGLLEGAIANLEGGDTLARTGLTVLSHGTPLALAIAANGTTLSVQDDIFAVGEIVMVSNTAGQIESMRIDSAATSAVGPGGAQMYQYSVTRRIATSPVGVVTGWALGTLANGLTDRGYILIDGRHDMSLSSPQLTAVRWLDSAAIQGEQMFRLGNLHGVAGVTGSEFGFAVGNLTSRDVYLMFNGDRGELSLRNADVVVIDPQSGAEAVHIWGQGTEERSVGDYTFGTVAGVHTEFFGGDGGRWTLRRGGQMLIDVDGEHSYLAGLFTIGEALGARAELGEQDGRAMILLRNGLGVVKVALTTNADEDVFAHIGNPAPQPNRVTFDGATGLMDLDGVMRARELYLHGLLTIADDGRMELVDPDDPQRLGVIDRFGVRGYSVDALGQQYLSSVDAWGPLTLENRPGSGVWRTWLAGEMMRGDPDYRHLRVERGAQGRVGLWNGETPVVYLDYNGDGHFAGRVYTGEGIIGGWGVHSTRLIAPNAYVTLDSERGVLLDVQDRTGNGHEEGIIDVEDAYLAVTFVDGPSAVHRLYATRRTVELGGVETSALIMQAQPVGLNTRAEVWLGSISDLEARTVLRAVGNYGKGNHQETAIQLWAYRGDGSGAPYGYRCIELDTDAVRLAPYTDAAEPSGNKYDGMLVYSDGAWNPGLGAGLYLYSDGAWVKVAGPRDGTTRWGDTTNYAQMDGDGVLTFPGGAARVQPRYGSETKTANFTAGAQTYYRVNTTAGAVTVTLPTAASAVGRVYIFKLIGGSNALTLDPDGSEAIDGASVWTSTMLYAKVTIISNGSNWEIIA